MPHDSLNRFRMDSRLGQPCPAGLPQGVEIKFSLFRDQFQKLIIPSAFPFGWGNRFGLRAVSLSKAAWS
jgi:hypothetical protein